MSAFQIGTMLLTWLVLAMDIREAFPKRCPSTFASASGQVVDNSETQYVATGCDQDNSLLQFVNGTTRPILAIRASRTQQLITKVVAAVFEDFLGMQVFFRDLREWQQESSYRDIQSGCYDLDVEHWLPSQAI